MTTLPSSARIRCTMLSVASLAVSRIQSFRTSTFTPERTGIVDFAPNTLRILDKASLMISFLTVNFIVRVLPSQCCPCGAGLDAIKKHIKRGDPSSHVLCLSIKLFEPIFGLHESAWSFHY